MNAVIQAVWIAEDLWDSFVAGLKAARDKWRFLQFMRKGGNIDENPF
jgi:hypothetical protein